MSVASRASKRPHRAAGNDEGRQVAQPAADRPFWDGERAGPIVRPDERVFLGGRPDEDAVVQPLALDELELALDVRAGEHEDDASVGAVVIEHAFGQHRTVAPSPPDHPVQTNVDTHLVVERVSRVCTPRVCAGWAFETAR